MINELKRVCREFTEREGQVAVIAQSKSDPSLSVSYNAELSLPSASVVKAAIACTAADLAARGVIDLKTTRSKRDLDDTFYCSILQAFDDEDSLTLKTLIGLMLIVSDNPATSAVLDMVGIDKVNAWLADQGMHATQLSIGFDDASLGPPLRANLTTARDCLTLLTLIDTDPTYAFVKRMLVNNLRNERIPKRLSDDAVIAHKTGTLAGLAHDIAIVDSPVANYFLIVLADGLQDEATFTRDLAAFSEAVYAVMAG